MGNPDLLNNDLQLSPIAQSYLTESAKWGKFLAIMGFIFCGFMVILAFIIPAFLTETSHYSTVEPVFNEKMNPYITVIYLMLAVLFFFPCLYLFKFSIKMKLATNSTSQENFDESLMNLKSMFKFYGFFTIVMLSVDALAFIITIIAAASVR